MYEVGDVVVVNIECSRCDGKGWIPDYYEPDYDRHECVKCGGEGTLKATVKILGIHSEE